MSKYSALEKHISIDFSDEALFQTAFTHRSYLNEHRHYPNPSNERLEFLGDAVLQVITSEHLYNNYQESPEGELTSYRAALVCTESLAKEAANLKFGKYLLLSRGEEDSQGRTRPYILANTFEAFLGALYLDKGFATCRKFLNDTLFRKLEEIIENKKYRDFKSVFQELAQDEVNTTPSYKVLKEWGPDHAKMFKVGVYLKDKKISDGEGASKQKAEEQAAKNALDNWGKT